VPRGYWSATISRGCRRRVPRYDRRRSQGKPLLVRPVAAAHQAAAEHERGNDGFLQGDKGAEQGLLGILLGMLVIRVKCDHRPGLGIQPPSAEPNHQVVQGRHRLSPPQVEATDRSPFPGGKEHARGPRIPILNHVAGRRLNAPRRVQGPHRNVGPKPQIGFPAGFINGLQIVQHGAAPADIDPGQTNPQFPHPAPGCRRLPPGAQPDLATAAFGGANRELLVVLPVLDESIGEGLLLASVLEIAHREAQTTGGGQKRSIGTVVEVGCVPQGPAPARPAKGGGDSQGHGIGPDPGAVAGQGRTVLDEDLPGQTRGASRELGQHGFVEGQKRGERAGRVARPRGGSGSRDGEEESGRRSGPDLSRITRPGSGHRGRSPG
jgi:hypothetical protein